MESVVTMLDVIAFNVTTATSKIAATRATADKGMELEIVTSKQRRLSASRSRKPYRLKQIADRRVSTLFVVSYCL